MINAKKEFLDKFGEFGSVQCAEITYSRDRESHNFALNVGHTEIDWNAFLQNLDFEYNNGYGTQYLFGTVWIGDITWAERDEYDGAEYWAINSYPDIPASLLEK